MNPIVHPWLTQIKELAHDDLERIGLEVYQEKQEFILWQRQEPLAAPARGPLAGLTLRGLVCGMESLIRLREGSQQKLELRERQAR
jgi:hypothetical protein